MRFAPDGPSLRVRPSTMPATKGGPCSSSGDASRKENCLPFLDFFGLAEKVIDELGVPEESTTRKVLKKAREIGGEVGVPGLISADRVFGLLEREFAPRDIRSAVARSLKPKFYVLSVGPSGCAFSDNPLLKIAARYLPTLIRLFERCGRAPRIHQPRRLPNPSRYDDLDGLVYLHGRVNTDYTEADVAGFVLSSSASSDMLTYPRAGPLNSSAT